MQNFTKKQHEEFKGYFDIKEDSGKWDNFYLKKAKKYISFIKRIPGLKMIGVGNSISMNCGKQESDIDLYIITEKNRLWFVRVLVTIIFQLFGVRKRGDKHTAKFCLSFFSTLNGMDFSEFAIKSDIYLYFWIIYFKPILDYDNTYKKFLEKNKSWMDFTEYEDILEKNKDAIRYKGKAWGKKYNLINYLDNLLKIIFLPITKKSFLKLKNPFGVIINDNLLKFHNKDIRKDTRYKMHLILIQNRRII